VAEYAVDEHVLRYGRDYAVAVAGFVAVEELFLRVKLRGYKQNESQRQKSARRKAAFRKA